MTFRYLSHVMKDEIPVYAGRALLQTARVRSIAGGDSSNEYQFTIGSHYGTHVDAPNHFFENGRKVSEYPPEFWLFRYPCVVKVTLGPSEILRPGRWLESIHGSSDVLLLQSGWTKRRDESRYSGENPGIDPAVGTYLRKRCPAVRAVGIDWISVSPCQDRSLGRQAHKAFLDPAGEHEPIVLIEDMDLSGELEGLAELSVLPLRIDSSDSAPCTIVGGFRDQGHSI